jgi:NADPH:quinone reductase-like Zn-dependent oxidoreductase
MKAIQIQAFGKPTDVAQCVDIADVGAPEANEVVVALPASPINPYDLLMIAGGYGSVDVEMVWHQRANRDNGFQWLRHELISSVEDVA